MLAACTTAQASDEGAETAVSRLSDDYDNALSVQGQLALGTVQLNETDLAVDETQAAELLPLWRALQSLRSSDTAATVEIEAIVNQIQDTMTLPQIQAIAGLALTADSMTELIESGELRRGGFGQDGNQQGDGGGAPAGEGPTGGFAGGPPPGGGFPGGGNFPGGGPGGATGNLSEDDIATRQAAFESGDLGGFQERALTGMVIRLLAEKTGEEIG